MTDLQLTRARAEQGDAEAQNSLGVMYDHGLGVPEDDAEAVTWYRRAAEQGLAVAQFNLGWMYAEGEGVPRDYVEAMTWFRLAAEQGYAPAQGNLGVMYDNGRGVPPAELPAADHDMAAKARLIAAAPDLLAALKELVDVVGGDFHALDKARAVIAKAEGRRSS